MSKLAKIHVGNACYQYTEDSVAQINATMQKHGCTSVGDAIDIIEGNKTPEEMIPVPCASFAEQRRRDFQTKTAAPEKPVAEKNDATFAGMPASEKVKFGAFGRYAIYAVHTRFECVQWFVTDAEQPDDNGRASVIRQNDDFIQAVSGL